MDEENLAERRQELERQELEKALGSLFHVKHESDFQAPPPRRMTDEEQEREDVFLVAETLHEAVERDATATAAAVLDVLVQEHGGRWSGSSGR